MKKRPEVRSECPKTRPCPWISCQYNLVLDVTKKGRISFAKYKTAELALEDAEAWGNNCALDHADCGGMTLDQAGILLGVVRERVRQIEVVALGKARVNGLLSEFRFTDGVDERDTYAEWLRDELDRLGMERGEFAERIGMTLDYVESWLKGHQVPGKATRRRIKAFFTEGGTSEIEKYVVACSHCGEAFLRKKRPQTGRLQWCKTSCRHKARRAAA